MRIIQFIVHQLWEQILRGFYPEPASHPERNACFWQAGQIQTYLKRDFRNLQGLDTPDKSAFHKNGGRFSFLFRVKSNYRFSKKKYDLVDGLRDLVEDDFAVLEVK